MSVLLEKIQQHFSEVISQCYITNDNIVTIEILPQHLISIAEVLHEEKDFDFKLLIDVCGVDYLEYGDSEWRTEETTFSGFSRGTDVEQMENWRPWTKPRFAVVYHLLSLQHNHRLRLKVFLPDEEVLELPSVCRIWSSANWYEREAFDLYGIIFSGHPDLRRLLTDYGFVGHPFRKDFPLIGEVELRYDAHEQRCVYEPVSIQPRTTVPKVVRSDNRYQPEE